MNGYELSRRFWEFTFENPSKIKTQHIALFLYAVEHCNKLNWKKEFGFPRSLAMEYTRIGSHKTYTKTLQDLVDYGFINVVQESKNQHQSHIICLVEYATADTKASLKQIPKQVQSRSCIDKPIKTNKTITNKSLPSGVFNLKKHKEHFIPPTKEEFIQLGVEKKRGVSPDDLALKWESANERKWMTASGEPIDNWRAWLMSTLIHMNVKKEDSYQPFVKKWKKLV